jgi:RND family efflux transporter MFP subunit
MPSTRPIDYWRQTLSAVIAASALVSVTTVVLHTRVAADEAPRLRPPMPVTTVRYGVEASFEREQRFLGLVQAASRSQIGFELPGAIAEVLVQEGDSVSVNQALARLDTQALEARRRAAASQLDRVAAELELARARTQRQAPLAETGSISAQTYDDTRLSEKALASALEAARAQLSALDIDLEKSVLRAPYNGQIGRQLLDRGAVTQPGAAVFTLTSAEDREAHIGIAVEQAGFLTPGTRYPLTWRGETYEAELRAVRSDVNPVSMTTVAIFALPAEVRAFDGEPVAVSLPRREDETGGWLPLSALIEGERGVWTVLALRDSAEGTLALREVVEVLHVAHDAAYVRGSLTSGDRVIADGVHRIAPGTLVAAESQLARSTTED